MKKTLLTIIVGLALVIAYGCSGTDNNITNTESDDLYKPDNGFNGSIPIVTTAEGHGHQWGDHTYPWDFLWDNGLDDTHEFKMLGNGGLVGFMYISFTEADSATGGTDVVGWIVHGIPANAHWSADDEMWVVSSDDVPNQPGYVHWHPLGDEEDAQGLESAPGYFLKHTARLAFYFSPQERWVTQGIDFDFPNNYITE